MFFPVFFLLLLFPQGEVYSQSPLMPPQTEEEKRGSLLSGDILPEWVKHTGQKAMSRIIAWQAQIRRKSAEYAREIRENPWGPAFWSYLGLAFVYGVIHALGPGHGKVFVSTYFLSRKASAGQAILMGAVMSSLHVVSAVVLVLLFYFVVTSGGFGSVDQAGRYLQKISAGLICLVGLFMIWKSGRTIFYGNHNTTCSCATQTDNKSLLSLALAVGLVPCPGAAMILFFSISLDILFSGMIAMLFLAAGLALTTVSFALVSLFARDIVSKLPTGKWVVNPALYHLPALIGAVCIALIGVVLFFNPVI